MILRLVAALAGIALLALATPRRSPWEALWLPEAPGWLLAAVALFVAVTAVVLLRGAVKRQAWLVGALCFLSMVPASPRGRGVVLALWVGLTGLLLITAGLATESVRARIGRWGARFGRMTGWRLARSASLFVLLASLAGSLFMLGGIPHIVDGAAQLFHAKILLAGKLWAEAPEPARLFEFTHMIQEGGRWYSQYPPGQLALLAIGLLVGAPWLVNPLLAAGLPLVCYPLGRELFGETVGRWTAACVALSPFVWLLASSFMSHTPMLFCFALFLLGYVRMVRQGGWVDGVVAGLALGCGAAIRPMTAFAVALPFLAHAVISLVRGKSIDRRRFAICCVVAALALSLPMAALLGFNQATNGAPLRFGYEALGGKEALPGFGNAGFWEQPHTPLRGWIATQNHLNGLNQLLFGLSLPALFLPLLGLLWTRPRSWDALLLASAGCLLAAHFFYWYQDWVFGPRFMHAAVLPLVLLTARALAAVPKTLAPHAALFLCLALLHGWLFQLPAFAAFYARNYEDGNPAVVSAVKQAELSNALVLVPDLWWPSLFPRNEPSLDGDVVFARELDPASTRQLSDRFPDRELYRLRSYDTYVVERDGEGSEGYALDPSAPLTVEALTFQLSHFKGAGAANRQMGETGGGWKNHDQLWAAGEIGFLFRSDGEQRRDLVLALTRSPQSGTVGIWLNGRSLGEIELTSDSTRLERIRFDGVAILPGPNPLLLRPTDARPFGLDYVSFD